MNKVLTGLLTIFFLSSLTTNYAFSGASSSDISSYNMKVNNVAVATLKSFDGGKVSAPVSQVQGISGNVEYEAATIQTYLYSGNGATNFMTWVVDSWSGNYSYKDVDIIGVTSSKAIKMQRRFTNAYITKTVFPTLDNTTSSSSYNGYITVKIVPETIEYTSPSGSLTSFSTGSISHWQTNKFALTIDNLDCSKVTKIESFSISITGTSTSTINQEVSNLKITLNDPNPTGWLDWHDDTVIKSQGESKNGTLSLKSSTSSTILSLALNDLIIFSLTPPNTSNSNKTVVELYCGSITKK